MRTANGSSHHAVTPIPSTPMPSPRHSRRRAGCRSHTIAAPAMAKNVGSR